MVLKRDSTINKTLILTIFSSFCSPCKTGQRIITLLELENILIKRNENFKIQVAFTEPFSNKDIEEMRKHINLPFPTYIIPKFWLLSADQRYITDTSLKNDPLTLVINTQKKVVFLEKIGITEEDILFSLENILSKNGNEKY